MHVKLISYSQPAKEPQNYPAGTHENYNSMMEKGKELEFPEGRGGGFQRSRGFPLKYIFEMT